MQEFIDISKDEIMELRNQGLKMSEIAARFGCSRDKLNRVLRGQKPKPLKKANCPICGQEYTYVGKMPHATCGSVECKKKHRQIREKQRHEQESHDDRIREYTETSNIMIIQDLEKGRDIKEIAKMYDRDPDDVKQQIDKIISNGTAGRIKRMLSAYQKYNTLKRGSGLL